MNAKNSIMPVMVVFFSMLACTFAQSSGDQNIVDEPVLDVATPISSTAISLPPASSNADSLIQPEDLEYLGAFRLPSESGDSTWDYSGRGLTYYPGGDANGAEDGYPGSLFGVGHDQQQYVSEISIPVPVVSKNLDDLNTAETIQPFKDITRGIFGETEIPRLGIQYIKDAENPSNDRLYFVHGQHFQDFEPSHGYSGLDLDNPNSAGPWQFDGYTNYVSSDYVFEIPVNWSSALPGTPILVTGRFREGVWGGRGPTLFAYNPSPDESGVQDISPLLLYGTQEPNIPEITSDDTTQMIGYNQDDSWWGGAWLTSADRSSVIFTGTKASGRSWYGFANGVVWEYDCADHIPQTCPDVPDWPYDGRGYWAETYTPQIIFYNPADLVKVANGQSETWQPQPYASLDLSAYFLDPEIDLAEYKTDLAGAVAYDRDHGLIYVVERLADEYKSVIHVWRIRD